MEECSSLRELLQQEHFWGKCAGRPETILISQLKVSHRRDIGSLKLLGYDCRPRQESNVVLS